MSHRLRLSFLPLVLVLLLPWQAAHAQSVLGPLKVQLPQGPVLNALRESHAIYGRNMKQVAAKELAVLVGSGLEASRVELFSAHSVTLPICNAAHKPSGWSYARNGGATHHLTYLGHLQNGAQFLSWGEGNWIRLSKARDASGSYNDEGMNCEEFDLNEPVRKNYARVFLRAAPTSAPKRKSPIADAILQLRVKAADSEAGVTTGEVVFSSAPALEEGTLSLELLERKNDEWVKLAKTSGEIDNGHGNMTRWTLSARATRGAEVNLLMRVEPKGRDVLAQAGKTGELYIYQATLRSQP